MSLNENIQKFSVKELKNLTSDEEQIFKAIEQGKFYKRK